ncbi:hypothetical protein CAP31_04495 [Sulfuriferula sp. AH1]|uniref:LamG domain-containing protein n=1 Tax=Sulfuriferula sp. AH1 TaxID=1985873 RepID=UPI000B3B4CBF|nr:LamG domain-containing protein [Sulfuriferula sp. AH1]ARU31013.1 hypothetical protein CAP31_04495 [Sulfuriferula sp. AH1]
MNMNDTSNITRKRRKFGLISFCVTLPKLPALRLILLACLSVLTHGAQAMTYANVSIPFTWIDTTGHTKVGYNTAPYKFNNTGGCGTTPPVLDDTLSDNIPIGFTFTYGGAGFTQARIMTNGRLQFNNNTTCGYGSPVTQLPYPNSGLNYTMRIYGNDLDPTPQADAPYSTACKLTSTCYISYATIGTAPNRQFVVTWNNIPEWAAGGSTSGNYNLQLILNENGTFIYQYGVDVPGPQASLGQVGWQVSPTDYEVPGVGLPANNSAILFYIPNPIAQYHFQQSAWTAPGQVLDTSGSSPAYNATALGGATPGPGYACNGAVIPVNNGAIVDGIDTGISVPTTLGGAGTIDFWYKANDAWKGGGDAQLLDASISNGEWFFATKLNNSDVRFVITDSTGTIRSAETATNNIAAGTWTHIALTWNFNALAASNSDHLSIYINGTQKALSAFTTSGTVSSQLGTLYLGDNRSSFTGSNGTKSSANGTLDEFNIYNMEGSLVLIQRDMSYATSCGPDHYELSLPSSSISCLPATATVTACADNSSPCTNAFVTASGTTATLATSAGTLANPTVTFGTTGTATTTLSYPTAANGAAVSVTLTGEQAAAAYPNKCCPDGINCATGNSCSTTFNTAGFIFSGAANGMTFAIPAQVAGVSSGSYYLRAVRTNTSTQACEAALQGTTAVNFAYECNDSATCYNANLMSVNGGTATTIARNNNGSVSSYLPVNMNFDANGNAPFTLNYGDAGKVTLHASKTVNATTLSGASNAFVVKPYSFVLSGIKRSADNVANPAAINAAGPVFIKAGDPFSATVTAITATGSVTPNYGQETTPENVKLTTVLVPGLGLTNNPAINGAFGTFTNGTANGTGFSWPEVGIITLTPDVADGDYLGAGNTTGTASENVGRFTPHHFETLVTQGCTAGNFTYSAQPFTVQITAKNSLTTPATTANYNGASNFAKQVTLTDGSAMTAGTFSNNTVAASSFAGGVATTATPQYTFTSPATAPATITLRATDSDGISSSGYAEGSAAIRSGRIKLSNASGSEALALPVPMVAQYYNGTTFVTNTADSCTSVPVPTKANSGLQTTLTTTASLASPFIAGNGKLQLSKPNAQGHVDITIAAPGWLQYNWKGAGLTNPTARATFGIYKNANEFIYMREMY